MNQLYDPYTRFFMILSLLSQSYEGITIKSISTRLGLSLPLIRDDFSRIFTSDLLKKHLIVILPDETNSSFEDDEDFYDEEYFYSTLDERKKDTVEKDFQNGLYDEMLFTLEPTSINLRPGFVYAPINESELLALRDYYPRFLTGFASNPFWTKDNVSPLSLRQQELLRKIKHAIKENIGICVTVKSNSGIISYDFLPKRIFYNTENNFVYIMGHDNFSLRLDTIRHIKLISSPMIAPTTDSTADYIWGVGYAPDEVPVYVKIKIINNTTNILNKIQADTASRKYGIFDKVNLTYEDKILGIDAFRHWLRSYGSSMIVLEPKWLAKVMYDSAKRMLACYETMTFEE